MSEHPIQPLEKDEQGDLRFKKNPIVRYLLDNGRINLNDLATVDFSDEDRQHFAQLIGYSLSGYGDLSYVSDEAYAAAAKMAVKQGDLPEGYAPTVQNLLEQLEEFGIDVQGKNALCAAIDAAKGDDWQTVVAELARKGRKYEIRFVVRAGVEFSEERLHRILSGYRFTHDQAMSVVQNLDMAALSH